MRLFHEAVLGKQYFDDADLTAEQTVKTTTLEFTMTPQFRFELCCRGPRPMLRLEVSSEEIATIIESLMALSRDNLTTPA